MIAIRIPRQLQPQCDGANELSVSAATVEEALRAVEGMHPQLGHALRSETGDVRGHVNIFVNTVDIRSLDRLDTCLRDGDTIHILPSVAGG